MNLNEVFGRDTEPAPGRAPRHRKIRVFTIVADTHARFGGLEGTYVLMDLNKLRDSRNIGSDWGPADNRVYLTADEARQLAFNLTTLADSLEFQEAVKT